MIITVKDSAPFQILTSAMVIGPSQTGYQLEVAADGRNFSPLFSVGPNVTRQATNLSSGAYYRLNGNVGEVKVNWNRSCVTEGGGGSGSGTELTPVTSFPVGAEAGTVVALVSGDTVGIYQYDGENWNVAGSDVDLSDYYTSAQTEDAIDEKTAKYFTKDAPIIMFDDYNLNAFFGEASDICLLDVTNGYYNDNPFDGDSEFSGDFTIDKENKEFYIENVPAGIYRIAVHANNVEDPTLTFKVWIDEEEIETNTTNDLPYAVDDRAALLSTGFNYRYANWSLDADAERITFKYDEENELFDVEVTYKPTIDEVQDQIDTMDEVVSAAIVDLKDKIDEISGATPSTEEIELPIAAAVNDLKSNIEARLDQKYYTKQEVNDIAARKLEAAQVDAQIKEYVDPAIAEVNASIEDKELATSAALNELNSTTVKSTSVKNIWTGSQSDYDDIVVKDQETLYIINN